MIFQRVDSGIVCLLYVAWSDIIVVDNEVTVCIFITCRMGGENLAVAQNTYAVTWFHGRELNMVFGLQLSFSRVVHNFFYQQNNFKLLHLE